VGNADLLNAMLDRLTAQRPQSGNALGTTDRDAATLASDFLSNIAGLENSIAQDQSFAAAHQGELKELELALGVDSDAELQKLILIERAYAANAKMVQAVDEMLQRLMEIG
jgi:flagellar hook-associated protein 1 FlgK